MDTRKKEETMGERIERMNREGAEAAALEAAATADKGSVKPEAKEDPLPLAKRLVSRVIEVVEEAKTEREILTKLPNARKENGEVVCSVTYHGMEFHIIYGVKTVVYYKDKPIYSYPEDKEYLHCPKCGAALVLRESQYGKFWGCSHFPDCYGKLSYPLTIKAAERYIEEYGYLPEEFVPVELKKKRLFDINS